MNRSEVVEIFEVDTIRFNGKKYSEIHLSITHINFDSNGHKRSSFTSEEVVELFLDEIEGLEMEADGEKNNLSFYAHVFTAKNGKKYKVVFSTDKGKMAIRLLTLFRKR